MALIQWVNLSKDTEHKDDVVTTVDRCGRITIELEVDNADMAIAYKARVVPVDGSDNAIYSDDELKRNKSFRMAKGIAGIVDAKKIRVSNIKLPAAGGNKYKIEIVDSNSPKEPVATSGEIETKRRLYYQTISMDDGKGNAVPAYSLANMESHSQKHHIEMIKKGSEVKMPYVKTVITEGLGHNIIDFGDEIVSAYKLSGEINKYGAAAVFSDYISDMTQYEYKQTKVIGEDNLYCKWTATHVYIAGQYYLWYGLDDAHDQVKTWFRDGYISYYDKETKKSLGYFINNKDIVEVATDDFIKPKGPYGGYRIIKIKIDDKLRNILNQKQGEIEFSIDVNVVAGWTNGFSWEYDDVKLITCARRVAWDDMPNNTREYTWNHEVGHLFGMTAWGNSTHKCKDAGEEKERDKLPDGPKTLYGQNRGVNDNGHSGPHCGNGAKYDLSNEEWSGSPKCVMFGADGIDGSSSPQEYCSLCAPIVRKVDLSR